MGGDMGEALGALKTRMSEIGHLHREEVVRVAPSVGRGWRQGDGQVGQQLAVTAG